MDLNKVWVVCEFCQTPNLFSNRHCSECGGRLNIELRITITEEDERKRLHDEQVLYEEEQGKKRKEYYDKVFAELSEWYTVPFEIYVWDLPGEGNFKHTVSFEEKDEAEYMPFEFKEPFKEPLIKKVTKQGYGYGFQTMLSGIVASVVFVSIGVSIGPTIIGSIAVNETALSGVPLADTIVLLGTYIGAFYYLGIALGAISLLWQVTKLR